MYSEVTLHVESRRMGAPDYKAGGGGEQWRFRGAPSVRIGKPEAHDVVSSPVALRLYLPAGGAMLVGRFRDNGQGVVGLVIRIYARNSGVEESGQDIIFCCRRECAPLPIHAIIAPLINLAFSRKTTLLSVGVCFRDVNSRVI
jgi:hypothetical protein